METFTKQPSLTNSSSAPSLPFTSRFFGNYLDTSNEQLDMSSQRSRSYYQANDAEQYVLAQNRTLMQWLQSMKRLMLRNALGSHPSMQVPNALQLATWITQKQRVVRKDKRQQPQYVMKVMLKVAMILNVKVKKKYALLFTAYRSALKGNKNGGKNANAPGSMQCLPDPGVGQIRPQSTKQMQGSSLAAAFKGQLATLQDRQIKQQHHREQEAIRVTEHNKKTKKLNIIIEGAIKLWQSCQKLQPKYFYPQLLSSAFLLLHQNSHTHLTLESAFQVISNGHSRMLELSWRHIKEWLSYLDRTDILNDTLSLMLHERTRFAMLQLKLDANNKMVSQSQLSNGNQSSTSTPKISAHGSKGFRKKDNPAETQVNNRPDLSGKYHPLPPADSTENILTQNIYHYRDTQDHTVISRNNSELSVLRSAEQASQIAPVRVCKHKTLPTFSKAVSRVPIEDYLNRELNSDFSRQFINVSQSTRALPLRNDELKKDLSDFNDLFFAREVVNFYLSLTSNKSERPSRLGGSSKVIEQYSGFAPEDLSESSSRQMFPLTFARKGIKSGKHSKRSSKSRSKDKSQDRNVYLSPLTFTGRHKMKIPTELPKNFDYYADKSLSNSKHKHHKGSSSSIGEPHKKKSQVETTRKIFNMVKGTHSDRHKLQALDVPKNTEGNVKTMRSSKSRAREKSARSRCEDVVSPSSQKDTYMMAFSHHPPKKRTRREA